LLTEMGSVPLGNSIPPQKTFQTGLRLRACSSNNPHPQALLSRIHRLYRSGSNCQLSKMNEHFGTPSLPNPPNPSSHSRIGANLPPIRLVPFKAPVSRGRDTYISHLRPPNISRRMRVSISRPLAHPMRADTRQYYISVCANTLGSTRTIAHKFQPARAAGRSQKLHIPENRHAPLPMCRFFLSAYTPIFVLRCFPLPPRCHVGEPCLPLPGPRWLPPFLIHRLSILLGPHHPPSSPLR
jgi:hypothetical protein